MSDYRAPGSADSHEAEKARRDLEALADRADAQRDKLAAHKQATNDARSEIEQRALDATFREYAARFAHRVAPWTLALWVAMWVLGFAAALLLMFSIDAEVTSPEGIAAQRTARWASLLSTIFAIGAAVVRRRSVAAIAANADARWTPSITGAVDALGRDQSSDEPYGYLALEVDLGDKSPFDRPLIERAVTGLDPEATLSIDEHDRRVIVASGAQPTAKHAMAWVDRAASALLAPLETLHGVRRAAVRWVYQHEPKPF
ncbi:MAG: hypothetical protein JNK05_01890 [Myxococcales bacterium]|nr:hypothetical protein [Myxococcales bacterium]